MIVDGRHDQNYHDVPSLKRKSLYFMYFIIYNILHVF
jgi:hypothetical protein